VILYSYKCEHCGNCFDERNSVEHRDDPAVCIQCGNGASRVFMPPQISIPTGFKIDKFRYNDYGTAQAIDARNELDSKRPSSASNKYQTFEETFREEYKRYK